MLDPHVGHLIELVERVSVLPSDGLPKGVGPTAFNGLLFHNATSIYSLTRCITAGFDASADYEYHRDKT